MCHTPERLRVGPVGREDLGPGGDPGLGTDGGRGEAPVGQDDGELRSELCWSGDTLKAWL